MNKIGVRLGGKQPIMRESKMNDPSLFGPYHNGLYPLQIDMSQTMQFSQSDPGPCCHSPSEQEKQQIDQSSGEIICRLLSKEELKQSLRSNGILNPTATRPKLQEQC